MISCEAPITSFRVTNVAVMASGILVSPKRMKPVAAFHTMKRRASRKCARRSSSSSGNGITTMWLPVGL